MQDLADGVGTNEEWVEPIQCIQAYHERSKHHLHRYAQSPDGLDWSNQPDPFRSFAGAPAIDLPLLADTIVGDYGDLYLPGTVVARPLEVAGLAVLFELALGLSAWKEYRGTRWALRCNPSSGNLHPTEGYAVLPPVLGLAAGVYHYSSSDHCVERRCVLAQNAATALAARLPDGSFMVGLSSVHWREAWKYGERAYRYCQHDLGHAFASIRYAAAALGWSARLLQEPGDAEVARWLGLNHDAGFAGVDALDREHPGALMLVGPTPPPELAPGAGPEDPVAWAGRANPLSQRHVRWEWIERAAAATDKPTTVAEAAWQPPPLPPLRLLPAPASGPVPTATLLRQRRSALAFDGRPALDASALYRMLDCLLPRPGVLPWDLLCWRPRLHLGLFLHRVSGLDSGLYIFERDVSVHDALRAACRPMFRWERPADCPDHLPLYLLAEGDLRQRARTICCHQDIAADGAFSLGMIAEFQNVIEANGPWCYRKLFWEAGVLGQVLYLEAEAAGMRATGIGCYFDDAFHDLFGLAGNGFQSLYHFAVGMPVDDRRLRTIAPYAHLNRLDRVA